MKCEFDSAVKLTNNPELDPKEIDEEQTVEMIEVYLRVMEYAPGSNWISAIK